jgi:DNA-binding CsgD family transcriptional regulator
MKSADPVRVIEAAYTYLPDEGAWLSSVMDASRAYDVGRGVLACTVDLTGRPRIRERCASPAASAALGPIESFVDSVSPSVARGLFAPTEFVGNAAFRVNRLTKRAAGSEESAKTPRRELPPLWALIAGDGTKNAVMVGFPGEERGFAPDQAFPHRDRRILGLVGAHLGAAMRLRTRVAGPDVLERRSEDPATEAVLSPGGRVLHAIGVGRSGAARSSLSEAVVRSERARGKLRRTDGEEATGLWKALVAGRWSIVEVVERDGKRLLLAKANPPSSPDVVALTKRESDVVWLVALGHSYKYVGYELGLTPSSVSRRLNGAMLKLGVSTRQDLIRKLAR